jgi:octopine/nopaline transport system ATP-binding protein
MAFAADVSTRAIFLHGGQIEEEGAPLQVFRDPQTERCRQFVMRHLTRGL